MEDTREWIITYYCIHHGHEAVHPNRCFYHYWNDSRGWVDERHEATEYTAQEMREKQLYLERVMTTDCRTYLMERDLCDSRIGQERV